MSWGIQPPEGTLVAFGARAILYRGVVDMLPDRMEFIGEPGEAREALRTFLREKGDAAIRRLARDCDPARRALITDTFDGYTVAVDTKASHGYLYIGVWPS